MSTQAEISGAGLRSQWQPEVLNFIFNPHPHDFFDLFHCRFTKFIALVHGAHKYHPQKSLETQDPFL